MIVVCGFCRTGTSIIMRCLKDSGFNPGEHVIKPEDLRYVAISSNPDVDYNNPNLRVIWGHQFFEHPNWGVMNHFISRHKGAEIMAVKGLYKGLALSLNREIPLSSRIYIMMNWTKNYFENKNVEILKDPWGTFALGSWIERFKLFQTAKYIWTRRDSVKRAKSQLRFQLKNQCLKGFLTTSKAMEIGRNHEGEIKKIMPLVNHIEIWLEDILDKTKEVGDKLSDFIGRKIDMSAINKSEVWGN